MEEFNLSDGGITSENRIIQNIQQKKLAEEFNLSSKISHFGTDKVEGYIWESDVFLFIKLLKEKLYQKAGNRVPNKINEISYFESIKTIDKLAGDKLNGRV